MLFSSNCCVFYLWKYTWTDVNLLVREPETTIVQFITPILILQGDGGLFMYLVFLKYKQNMY